MPIILFLLTLLILPFAEIAIFIVVGSEIGVFPTLAITILSAIIGIAIVRRQGLDHVRRLQTSLKAGEPPLLDLLHTVLLVIAGLLLLFPGLLTDALGVVLLLPPVRTLLGHWLIVRLSQPRASGGTRTVIIEGEAWESEPDDTGGDPGRHRRLDWRDD